jgi:site-specific recombinase XerD
VAEVVAAFLDRIRNREVKSTIVSKYKTLTKQLVAYCTKRGYLYIDQLSVTDMDGCYGSWKDGIKAKARELERLEIFVKFCWKRNWLAENIANDLETAAGAPVIVPKSPFEDGELQRIYDARDWIGDQAKLGPGYRTSTGEDAKDGNNRSER